MWLSLAWKVFTDFIGNKLDEKAYKTVLLLVVSLFLVTSVVMLSKVSSMSGKIDASYRQSAKNDSAMEARIINHINQRNVDAIEIFQGYAINQAEDLKTIIDKTGVTADNTYLLKKIVDKSNSELMQEIKQVQFRSRYGLPDSGKINSKKLSLLDTIMPSLYAKR